MYKKGEAKAKENFQKRVDQNQRFTVIGLLDATALTDAQIITICNVPTELMHAVKKDLAAAPAKITRLRKTLSAQQIAEKLNLPINWVEKHL